jgi:pyridoxal phosphate enzyme (YggS family)
MNSDELLIKNNLEEIWGNIEKAAAKTGRNARDIKIVAVTKNVEVARMTKVIDLGIKDLGENRVQELSQKYDSLNKEVNWHLIGHLQKNKVKYIIDKVTLIHSIDRIELAKEIQKRAERINRTINVLVQVNISEEASKFGIHRDKTLDFMKKISVFPNVRVKGLMTIAPLVDNSEDVRYVFRGLRNLLIDIRKENIDNIDMELLSMGMSNDYQVAVEEGSNILRIGTAIFGRRPEA